ncbi:MAG: fibronectin type III domain-containing protein, partial [Oscillospiraceae bacterium]|nr:fibronectin type III domain-containing protein [Oscillospiraceae bacterium]
TKVGIVTIMATSKATDNFNAATKKVRIKIVPAATASIKAENLATRIRLTWKKVTGATGYLVYRGDTKIATIKSGSTVTYTDTKANTNGSKYTFKIIPRASTGNGPAKSLTTYRVSRPSISSVNNTAAGKITVKWGKNAKGTGYQIQYCTDKTFNTGNKSVSIKSASTISKVIGSLTKGKTYYVRIRTYKTVGSKKYFSGWSAVKTVKINK